jgi:hypothetical protein
MFDPVDLASVFDAEQACSVRDHQLMKQIAKGLVLYGISDGARFILDNLREWPDLGLLGECRRCHSTLIVCPPTKEVATQRPDAVDSHAEAPSYQGEGLSRSGRRRPPRTDAPAGFEPRDRDPADHDRHVAEFFAAFYARRYGVVALAAFAENGDVASTNLRAAIARELRSRNWRLDRIGRVLGRTKSAVAWLLRRPERNEECT